VAVGRIRYREFVAGAISQKDITDVNLKVAFETMSQRRSYITADDVKQLMGVDGTAEGVREMLAGVGLSVTDHISFEEVSGRGWTGLG